MERASSCINRLVTEGKVYLNDEEIMEDHLKRLKVYDKSEEITGWIKGVPREVSEKLPAESRRVTQEEVNLGFTLSQAVDEASRCMRCYYIAMVVV